MTEQKKILMVALLLTVYALFMCQDVLVIPVMCYKSNGTPAIETAFMGLDCGCKQSARKNKFQHSHKNNHNHDHNLDHDHCQSHHNTPDHCDQLCTDNDDCKDVPLGNHFMRRENHNGVNESILTAHSLHGNRSPSQHTISPRNITSFIPPIHCNGHPNTTENNTVRLC